MRYKGIVAYDGSKYKGWQKQPHGQSVQQHIEAAMKLKFDAPVNVIASGRTDTGVHALGQVVHFDYKYDIEPERFRKAINKTLNKDVHFLTLEKVSDEFHSRFNVVKKEYWYTVNVGKYETLNANRQLQVCCDLDLKAIQEAAKLFEGEHDFVSFSNDPRENTVRIIYYLKVEKENDIITFKVNGTGFLNHMIRNIVGCLIAIGKGKITKDHVIKHLNNPVKGNNYYKANPEGLCLMLVEY